MTYRNSWVTDLVPAEENIADLVLAGRARWKIENETFNTLKNQGYHLEHNFGHGEKHLSFNFFLLNLLAFALHQIHQIADPLYQEVRQEVRQLVGSRARLWERLRNAIEFFLFPNWEAMLSRVLEGRQPP